MPLLAKLSRDDRKYGDIMAEVKFAEEQRQRVMPLFLRALAN
jgi:hypothetical protein